MADEELCPRCKAADETILHVLRDCPFPGEVWTRLGYSTLDPFRQVRCPSEWIRQILSHAKALHIDIGCWFLWKARNEWLFAGNKQSVASLVHQIESWVLQVTSANIQQDAIGDKRPKHVQKDIVWDPGEAGWVILNTNGSVYPGEGSAAAGGLIQNGDGRCLLAYCANLGKAKIMKAELRGVIDGLREGNFAADYLANLGHSTTRGVHLISLPDCNLSYFLRRDCMGISEPRLIPR
ncbi:Putative ribonuclease H protein At1g65750 [Linum perenne]